MRYSVILRLTNARAFAEVFADLCATGVAPEELELVLLDAGESAVDTPRLVEKARAYGLSIKSLEFRPGTQASAAYGTATTEAAGDILIYLDSLYALPHTFFQICDKFADNTVAWVPRAWQPVVDTTDQVPDVGFWRSPSYTSVVLPRHIYGQGRVRWSTRGLPSPYEEYLNISEFAHTLPVVVAKCPGLQVRQFTTLDRVLAQGAGWRLTASPTPEGIHADDATAVLAGQLPHTTGVLLPVCAHSAWDGDISSILQDVLQEVLQELVSGYRVRPEIEDVEKQLAAEMWRRYWDGQIPIVPRFRLEFRGDKLRVSSANEVELPFNREGQDGPQSLYETTV